MCLLAGVRYDVLDGLTKLYDLGYHGNRIWELWCFFRFGIVNG